jgi:hypothetical protein
MKNKLHSDKLCVCIKLRCGRKYSRLRTLYQARITETGRRNYLPEKAWRGSDQRTSMESINERGIPPPHDRRRSQDRSRRWARVSSPSSPSPPRPPRAHRPGASTPTIGRPGPRAAAFPCRALFPYPSPAYLRRSPPQNPHLRRPPRPAPWVLEPAESLSRFSSTSRNRRMEKGWGDRRRGGLYRKCYTYGRLRMIYALTRTESDVATKKMRASC